MTKSKLFTELSFLLTIDKSMMTDLHKSRIREIKAIFRERKERKQYDLQSRFHLTIGQEHIRP